MEPHTALIGTDSAVELDPVGVVHLDLALVIHPGHPEQDAPLGGGQPLQQGVPAVSIFVALDDHPQGLQHLFHRLVEFGLTGVLGDNALHNFINIAHRKNLLKKNEVILAHPPQKYNSFPVVVTPKIVP